MPETTATGAPIEVRDVAAPVEAGDDGRTLDGYAAVFNEPTRIRGFDGDEFDEIIAPGAFRETLAERGGRVRLQFDHGRHPLLGEVPLGRIERLGEDERGLRVQARLAENWLVEPFRESIASGAVSGMSFRFAVPPGGDDVTPASGREDGGDVPLRTIRRADLYEVGPVVWPAYEQTSVSVRDRAAATAPTGDEPAGNADPDAGDGERVPPARAEGPTPTERRTALFPFLTQE